MATSTFNRSKPIIMKTIGIALLIIIGLVGVSFGVGYLNAYYTKTVGKTQQNATTEVFHSSQAHTTGVSQEISKEYLEFTLTKDTLEKKALSHHIIEFVADEDHSTFTPEDNRHVEEMKQFLQSTQ